MLNWGSVGPYPAVLRARAADDYVDLRQSMVREQILARGVSDRDVLAALRGVPRHRFVPPSMVPQAYNDHPLPIGNRQTISQPYIVAFMSELLDVEKSHKVLEIGTGCGYQAAVLSVLADQVYSMEIVEELGVQARQRLRTLGYDNVEVRIGNGYAGWPEQAPFDRIILTAAPNELPRSARRSAQARRQARCAGRTGLRQSGTSRRDQGRPGKGSARVGPARAVRAHGPGA